MILVNGAGLTIGQVQKVVRGRELVSLDPKQLPAVDAAQEMVERLLASGQVVYGITTGFGKLADTIISPTQVRELQRNLILSHCSGVGDPLPREAVKAMMLLRVNALMKGYSGIRSTVIQLLVDMINSEVIPVVYAQGSVGASGDLVPLAHMVLVMMGEGEASCNGQILPGREALKSAGLNPVVLEAKEGLALINGTQLMTALGALGVHDAHITLKTADIGAALTMEALGAIPDAFDERVQTVRPHPGQTAVAANLRRILNKSGLVYRTDRDRVQDAYSLRCVPQVHGASKDTINYVEGIIEREMNSVTDNPILFVEDEQVLSAGNFHGQPVALGMDFLGIALAEIANITERRIERMVNPALSGLPAFLTGDSGINSGYMIAQYAAASLVSENKVLAHPASVDSIPTSANQEDHVSMGTIGARKMINILANLQNVVAIELMCAAQALEFGDKEKLSPVTECVYALIRSRIGALKKDRQISPDISGLKEMVKSGEVLRAVEDMIGTLE